VDLESKSTTCTVATVLLVWYINILYCILRYEKSFKRDYKDDKRPIYIFNYYTYTSFLQRFGLHSFVLNVSLEINRATCGSARVESDAKYEACNKCNVVTKP